MQLEVRLARPSEKEMAWPLYRSFIEKNIYPKCSANLSTVDWCDQEKTLFLNQWEISENYIIDIDGEGVGWAGVRKSNNTITIENIFVQEEWLPKGVVEKILEEMTNIWKLEKRVIHVPVMDQEDTSKGIIETLQRIGFSRGEHDGLAQTMTANFAK